MTEQTIDVDRLRRDTPGCDRNIHFNSAGSSPMPSPVHNAVAHHLNREREIGGYQAEHEAEEALQAFYANFARLLNAEPDEIAYVENATRAWDMVFYGLPLQPGDRVLTHGAEYVSNFLAMLQVAKARKIEIDVVPSDTHGQIDVAAMSAMITPRTRAVAITHVPTQGGLVNPAQAVGDVARKHGLFYLLDACQSAGQLALDVEAIGCDALSGTGRKFLRGPRGTGFLYVRRSSLEQIEPPFIDLRSANWEDERRYSLAEGARRFENWECHVAGKIGLGVAVHYALETGIDAVENRIRALSGRLREQLATVPQVSVHDQGQNPCGIVTFDKRGSSPPALSADLIKQNMFVSVSSVGSARLDLGRRGIDSLVRASVHAFNTDEEVDRFCATVDAHKGS